MARAALTFILTFGLIFPATQARAAIAQAPLLLPSENVPGSLALVPSVEWPTILSVANLGNYSSNVNYTGYFDSAKCYLYQYDASNTDNTWFYPNGAAVNRKCNVGSAKKQWSGNFLNWAATPTIDPFRSALTGGYRYRDTASLTVLQKARHDGQSAAGNRIEDVQNNRQGIVPQVEITGATPAGADWGNFYIRLQGLDYDMLFSTFKDGIGGGGSTGEKQQEWVEYQPSLSIQFRNGRLVTDYTALLQPLKSIYRVKLRVKVCDPSSGAGGVEANCEQYGNNYKPQGLLQQYAGTLRYSAFSYLNDSSNGRDGGVLRANQKYIGPTLGDGGANNTNKEWSATDGVLVKNPNPNDATATGNGVIDSGVINYLNKFGSMSDRNHKSLDPVSELYYTAVRYFKNQGNVRSYSNLNDNAAENYKTADGFPVITQWNDPITYSCQKNVVLGIGDVNTHRDKNLPGATSGVGEPSKPTEVTNDTTVDVVAATAKVGALEGVGLNQSGDSYTGRSNSAYIAGLAYDSHTKDLRADRSGTQTLSTYWVDVRENQTLASRAFNQYWLAAKYGGFTVPKNFQPYSADTTAGSITDEMWWTTGQYLSTGDKRPDNFFVASDAQNMVNSLKLAFAKIAQETRSSTTTSLATNSTQLDTGSAVFQSLYDPAKWSGDLLAKTVSEPNAVEPSPTWSAASKLDALTADTTRSIFTSDALTGRSNNSYSTATSSRAFTWTALDDNARTLLKSSGTGGNAVDDTVGASRLAYLRGDRSQERNSSNPTRPFRERASRLGDIVNSDPQYIHKQDFGYNLLSGEAWATAGSRYQTFRSSSAYQNRAPIIAVGANDGMLHIFNASLGSGGGSELFAYVPRNVLGSLHALTDPAYTHRYYVDGTPAFSDAWINNAWKTIAVGTTGAGGKSIFALDVTNPASMGASSLLWEFTAPDMGYPIQQAKIVALANGKFGVIVSSGFVDTTVSSGQVWVLDAADGSVIKKFSLRTSGGLGEPLAIDLNNDRIADRIYVGDTTGKLWRLDINATEPANWDAPASLKSGGTISPLFIAADGSGNTQPITAPLSAALNKDGSALLLFGTGSFYQATDTDLQQNQRIESFYGLIDKNEQISRSALQEQKIINQRTASNTNLGRAVSQTTLGADTKGWYLDLLWKQAEGGSNTLTGERVISRPVLRNGAVVFSTLTPSSDPCKGGGSSWVMALDVFSGGRLTQTFFDANGNGQLGEGDYYTDGDGNKIPYSGIQNPQYGAIKTPTFFDGAGDGSESGDDLICFSGSAGGEPFCSPTDPLARSFGRVSWREVNR